MTPTIAGGCRGTAVCRGRFGLALALWCALLAGCKSAIDSTDIKETYGPIGRMAKNRAEQAKRDEEGKPYAGLEELNAARKLYEEQKYAQARKAFHKIVKNKKYKNEPVVEEAMFYRAESDFQLGHYPAADDGYAELLKAHPATKHLEQAVKRQYAMACYWLNVPKPASQIELASFTDEDGAERLEQNPDASIPFEWRIKPNLTDKTRPLFDTPGRAVQALRSVTLHDCTSPVADDARMLLATYHLRKRDYREADSYFNEIRTNPQHSKYAEAAYVLGAHASLKSYLGANYDGKQLEEAQKLTESATRIYPTIPQRAKLDGDLRKIRAEMVEREWKRVEYYLKRREKGSAAVHCKYIIDTYPDSPQAVKAREALQKLGPEHAAGYVATPLIKKDPPRARPPEDEPEEPARLKVTDEGASPAPVEE
ncbi:MAG: outer membrane protein assembly factor BamD [Planctomycetia bacterium]|nr:outer membrane protein assembly factor BamD [Planctomycetia bacterium]